jgi:sulfite reductase (ferredoxin)
MSTEDQYIRTSIAGRSSQVETEINRFERSIERVSSKKVSATIFLEERLRMGVYGQRQDGVHMMRSKLPLGLLGPDQLEAFADLTSRYSHGIAHLTTRQDIQVHFVKLEETPEVMRVLDAAEMTSKEACGNVVRNIVGSAVAGVSPTEAFDITPHGMALARFLLRHPDGASLGRKFKIALAGCADRTWNLGSFHDIGLTATLGGEGGEERGFEVVVGGGLGAVAYEAVPYTDFLPEAELLSFCQAVLRVFALHGQKKNRARARLKFLVAAWGIDRFRAEVEQTRSDLHPDPEWTQWLSDLGRWDETPLHPPGPAVVESTDPDFQAWLRTNVFPQRQPGYAAVKVRVPQGDLSADQLHGLAEILRRHCGVLRITPDQALLLRWVPTDRLDVLRADLSQVGLDQACAGGLGDTVACPGADSCKLGITAPRAIARAMGSRLDALARNPRLEGIRIHVSGCPNGCAQHQVADIGFFGAARTIDGHTAPHYVLHLGGLAGGSGGASHGQAFGMPVTKVAAALLDEAIERLLALYLAEGLADASFGAFSRRLGRGRFKLLLQDLVLPSFETAPEMYREPGSDQEFAIQRGKGECAGEVVDQVDLLLADADREADTALEILETSGEPVLVIRSANDAMLHAARAMLAVDGIFEGRPERIESQFRKHYYDTGRIFEGIGHYFLQSLVASTEDFDSERTRRLVVEAGLFVEEAHSLVIRGRGLAAFPRGKKAASK